VLVCHGCICVPVRVCVRRVVACLCACVCVCLFVCVCVCVVCVWCMCTWCVCACVCACVRDREIERRNADHSSSEKIHKPINSLTLQQLLLLFWFHPRQRENAQKRAKISSKRQMLASCEPSLPSPSSSQVCACECVMAREREICACVCESANKKRKEQT